MMSEKAKHSAEYEQAVEALNRLTDDEVNKAYAEAQERRAEARCGHPPLALSPPPVAGWGMM